MLELYSLLLQHLDLAIGCVKLDLDGLQVENNVLHVRPTLQQFLLGFAVVLLLFIVSFNPHISGFLLCSDSFIEICDLICLLLPKQLKLLLNGSLLNF